jgi:hypothetical protein
VRSLDVIPESLLASAHWELIVALVKNQGSVCRSCTLVLANASGRQVLPGAVTPFLY